MIKSGRNYEDINNYRNSRYFAQTVRNIRKNSKNKNLVIFAGACQSYYEALISAGANFASSPARILIDFIDPLVVAEKIATTDSTKFLTIRDIEDDFYNVMVIVSGVGEYPDENFIFLGISIREVLEEFKVDSKNIPDNQASVIYPIVYNVLNGTIYSDLTENSITIKSCITHTSDNKEQVPNA